MSRVGVEQLLKIPSDRCCLPLLVRGQRHGLCQPRVVRRQLDPTAAFVLMCGSLVHSKLHDRYDHGLLAAERVWLKVSQTT